MWPERLPGMHGCVVQLSHDVFFLPTPGKGSHANYERPGEHTRLMGLANDVNDDRGFFWNKQARLVAAYPPAVLRYGGRLSSHVVNAWEQVRAIITS